MNRLQSIEALWQLYSLICGKGVVLLLCPARLLLVSGVFLISVLVEAHETALRVHFERIDVLELSLRPCVLSILAAGYVL